ncbi:MAG: hypothetical protein WBQ86_01910 [Candidatus Binatus sp.]
MAGSLDVTVVAIGVAYPFLVYFGLRTLPPGLIAFSLVALLAAKAALGSKKNGRESLPYLIAAVIVIGLAARSPVVGLKAYPVLLSLGFGAVFAHSLLWPPTIVERIARLTHPELPLEANSYLRKVTIAWLIFFIVNAAISAATAASGSLRLWTLYNGLISYLAMGVMFATEFVVRQFVHRRLRISV